MKKTQSCRGGHEILKWDIAGIGDIMRIDWTYWKFYGIVKFVRIKWDVAGIGNIMRNREYYKELMEHSGN